LAETPEILAALSPEEIVRMVHELRVHQVELEMQNEELRRAHVELDAARERYFELYELAPVGYCTVNQHGKILEANLAAASLLGVPRGQLAGQRYSQFIFKDDVDCYHLHHKALFEAAGPQSADVRMAKQDGTMFWARMEATVTPDALGEPLAHVVLTDINARRRAEASLAASRAELQAVYDYAPVMMCVLDADRQVLYANPAFTCFTGVPEHELKGGRACGVFGCVNNADDPRGCGYGEECGDCGLRLALEETLRSGRAYINFEHHAVYQRDGVRREAELLVSIAPVQLAGRSGLLLCLNDVSERKRAEQDYQTLFRQMQNGFTLHEVLRDRDGRPVDFRFLAVNPAFERMTGLRAEDLVGRAILEWMPGMDPREFEVCRNVVETGEPGFFESFNAGLDKYFEVVAFRPAPNQCACVITDITDRKRAEAALRESEALYRSIMNASPDEIIITDLEGRVAMVSPMALTISGCEREEELIGCLVTDFVAPEERERAAAMMAQMFQGFAGGPVQYRALRRDGSPLDVEAKADFIRDGQGNPSGLIFVVRDITERQALEAQLRQSQKMESIGRLAGGVAHDFNNLLTVINGYSEMILAEMSASDPLRAPLAEISKAGERAASLTRQLLAYSRKQVLQPRELDLNLVVKSIRPMLERLLGEEIEVQVALSAQRAMVRADPSQLEQVIMNLALNARDAMPGGGVVRIETSLVDLGAGRPGGLAEGPKGRCVMLTVSDSGVGMDEATRLRIFEPFFTTKPMGQGTGLGLSMVQGIVMQSGGSVEVESEPGRGTTLRVCLPALAETAAETVGRASLPEPRGTETILVVEDQPEVLRYAVVALRAYGYQVMEASSADEAFAMIARDEGPIHLVLTDVVMPNMGGVRLAAQLEQIRPGIRVLFMSGYAEEIGGDAASVGAGGLFIQKPFSPRALAAKVRSLLHPDAGAAPPRSNTAP